MAATKIEWAEEVWNPVTGCTKISPACDNCYAEKMAIRLRGRYGYPQDEPFKVTLHENRLTEPLAWRKPRIIFVCSMADLFHHAVPFAYIKKVWRVMAAAAANGHTFLILTKRPQRMLDFLLYYAIKPLHNVWLGTTIENQPMANKRVPLLLQCPAVKHFVSYEPALGPLVFKQEWLTPEINEAFKQYIGGQIGFINWVIAGGESGHKARPAHPVWFRTVRDQCEAAGVPFMFKQWGTYRPAKTVKEATLYPRIVTTRPDGWCADGTYHLYHQVESMIDGKGEYCHIDCAMVKLGKKNSGRLLDGVEHMEVPN